MEANQCAQLHLTSERYEKLYFYFHTTVVWLHRPPLCHELTRLKRHLQIIIVFIPVVDSATRVTRAQKYSSQVEYEISLIAFFFFF